MVLTSLLFVLNITIGSSSLSFNHVLDSLFNPSEVKKGVRFIVNEVRLPRALTALISGAALAIAGLFMQTIFRNPLAGPFILGINSGASLGVAILIMGSSAFGLTVSGSVSVTTGAFLGAIGVFSIVLLAATKIKNSISLLLIGMMLAAFSSAIVNMLQYFSSAQELEQFVIWGMGSFGSVTLRQIPFYASILIASITASILILKPLNALLLGENNASISGVKVKQTRIFTIIITCLLAGIVTAYCGPISFIGLAIPNITRYLFKTSNHFILFPAVIFMGSSVALLCSIIAQLPGDNAVLPINIVTSFIGAPIVIWIILKNRKMQLSL